MHLTFLILKVFKDVDLCRSLVSHKYELSNEIQLLIFYSFSPRRKIDRAHLVFLFQLFVTKKTITIHNNLSWWMRKATVRFWIFNLYHLNNVKSSLIDNKWTLPTWIDITDQKKQRKLSYSRIWPSNGYDWVGNFFLFGLWFFILC